MDIPCRRDLCKTFMLATNEANPKAKTRLETRLLVRDANHGVHGATYKWRTDNSDADLLESQLTETILIQTATGIRSQQWYYPRRQDCRTCHNAVAGLSLGVKARKLNRDFTYPPRATDNELHTWNHLGLWIIGSGGCRFVIEPTVNKKLRERDMDMVDGLVYAEDQVDRHLWRTRHGRPAARHHGDDAGRRLIADCQLNCQ